MERSNKLKFYRSVIKTGESLAITIPKEICKDMKLIKGTKITLTYDKDEIGNYITLWKE